MSVAGTATKYLVIAVVAGAAAAWVWQLVGSPGAVKLPALSPLAAAGKAAYDANCASCHGLNAAGTDSGPPFIHDIYNPGHHPDAAFVAAARLGVRQHHWTYGNMPPQPQVTDVQLAAIIRYVRELQLANGISGRPHTM